MEAHRKRALCYVNIVKCRAHLCSPQTKQTASPASCPPSPPVHLVLIGTSDTVQSRLRLKCISAAVLAARNALTDLFAFDVLQLC